MNQTRSIYRKPKFDYNKELTAIDKLPTTAYNKQMLREWHNHLSAKEAGCGNYRICKLSAQMRRILLVWHELTENPQLTNKKRELNTIDKDSFEQVLGWINKKEGWSLATRADYRRCIKQFFGWYEEKDNRLKELPEIDITASKEEQHAQYRLRQEIRGERKTAKKFHAYIKTIKRNYRKKQVDVGEVLTDNDIRQVIEKGAKNSRDRAIIAMLHELGLRAGELLNIKIKDLDIQTDRVLVSVDGKTGRRTVPLILNMPYLLRWLADHPHGKSGEAYLWLGLSSKNKDQPIFHSAVARTIDKAFKRAGINKTHNLHWFRHSRASLYYGKMTEGEMEDFFGWVKGSDMVRNYCHTDKAAHDEALNRIYHIQQQKRNDLALLECAACGLNNKSDSNFCGRCGRPLSTDAHQNKEAHIEQAINLMKKIYSDDKLRQKFEQFSTEKET